MDTLTMLEEMQQRARRDADVKSALRKRIRFPLSANVPGHWGTSFIRWKLFRRERTSMPLTAEARTEEVRTPLSWKGRTISMRCSSQRFKAGQARLRLVLNHYKLLSNFILIYEGVQSLYTVG